MFPLRIIVTAWLALLCSGEDSLVVPTLSGEIRGLTVDGIEGRTVDAFLGIPYGAPTGGQNRFSPPKEVSPWDGVFDATKFSKQCYYSLLRQFKDLWWVSNSEETEDCLKLNIWVPKPRPKSSAVMVWIHGGAFMGGSSDIPLYNGARLASSEDVIVVSLNYRVSIYGFLYLAHPSAPGNMGLMDQTLGLQWVKKNIKAFGGDPNRVTIFGESAGGAAVGCHLLSPASLDLFQNAIMQSGSATSMWAFQNRDNLLKENILLAESAGCPVKTEKIEETIRCLQELSHEKLLDVLSTQAEQRKASPFTPVIDGKYLPAYPHELLSKGKVCSRKNVLVGYTKHDGSFIIPVWTPPEFLRAETSTYVEEDLRKIISSVSHIDPVNSGPALDLVCHTYSEWNPSTSNDTLTFDAVIQATTDRWFGCPSISTAEQVSQNGNSVFLYRFDHLSETKKPEPSWLGVYHGSEIPLVFGHVATDKSNQEEVKLSRKIMRYWSNFANTGDPNDYYLPNWAKYTTQNKEYLKISGKDMKMEKVQELKKCYFWDNIFPNIRFTDVNEI